MNDTKAPIEDDKSQNIMNNIGKATLSELGLDDLSEDSKLDLLMQLTEVVQARLTERIIDLMSDEELAGFNKILEEKGNDAANAYVLEVVPSYETMALEEYRKLVNEIQAQQGEVLDIIDKRREQGQPEKPAV